MSIDEPGLNRGLFARASGPQSGPPGQKFVIATTALVSTASVLPSFLVGAMAIQIRGELGITASGIGLAFAGFFCAGALASAPSGRLADRGDPRVIAAIAAIVSGLTSLVVAALVDSLPMVVACLAVAGVANAVCQTAANLIIVRALPVRRQGFALAVKQSAIPGATLLAGLAVPTLAASAGWRWAFVLHAVLAFATAASIPRDRSAARRVPARDRVRPDVGAVARPRPDVPVWALVLLAAAAGLAGTAASSLGSFLVSAAVEADVPESAAGLLLTASSITGIAVRLIAGARADRRGRGHFRVVSLMIGCGAFSFVLLAIDAPISYFLAAPLAFSTAWAWPGLFNLAIVRVNPSSPASATGITQTGQFIGGVVGPLLFGITAEHAGFRPAWLMASGIAAAGVTALLLAMARIKAR